MNSVCKTAHSSCSLLFPSHGDNREVSARLAVRSLAFGSSRLKIHHEKPSVASDKTNVYFREPHASVLLRTLASSGKEPNFKLKKI